MERDDDAFTSAVDSLIFPVSQTPSFDFSKLAADGHQTTLSGLQDGLLGSPHPGHVTAATSTSESTDITLQPLEVGALTFALHNIGGVTPGSQAEAGFQRAAALWQSFLGDPVTVRLDVGFSTLGPGILGSTGAASKVVSYSAVRTALTADKLSNDDAAAVASLSAGSSLAFFTNNSAGTRVFDNDGSANNTFLNVTTADLKALGITTDANGQPVDTGAADGSITFSSDFTWDFDPTNGITAGAIDFVGVAFHEIGHALGFVSGVDVVDAYSGFGPGAPFNLNPYAIFSTLDLFRYSGAGVRDLSYGGTKYFSINGGVTNLALFSTGDFQGDGNQASHWKDGLGIGIMDPTSVPAGQANVVTSRDIQALDVIGWNLAGNSGPGSIAINDMQIREGNGGVKLETFTVTRTGGTAAFDVSFATSDNSATVGDGDYVAKAGTLHFDANVNTQTVSVTINGDTKLESNESFFVNLSGATNGAAIIDSLGVGTIVDDDTNHAATNDFNGDGYSDILWRNNSSGDTGYSEVHGNVWHSLGGSSTAYSVAGAGDFNGDGFSDILWRNNSSGDTAYSDLHGNAWHGLGGSPTAYNVVGVGDFSGDSFSDILWRNNSSGDTGYSEVHGNAWHGLGTFATAYSVAGVGDFNGDSFGDILWRNNSSGDTAYSDLHAGALHGLGGSPTAYSVVGVGDFSGDGFSDILWRNNSSGDTGYSEVLGNVWHSLGASSTAYSVAGVGDFNGDSFSDILWRNNSSGDTAYSDVHGNAWHDLGLAPTTYLIVA